MSEHTNQLGSSPSASNLPALANSTTTVLRRTQTTLGLLREVVQEGTAEYWHERGEKARAAGEWNEAIYCYHKCRETPGDMMRIQALQGLAEALETRAECKAHKGDFEGSYWDKRSAEYNCEELAYWEDCAETYWSDR